MLVKQYIVLILPIFYVFPMKSGDYGIVSFVLAILNFFLAVSCVKTARIELKIGIAKVMLWILLLTGTVVALFLCIVWLTAAFLSAEFFILCSAVVEYSLLLWSLLLPLHWCLTRRK